MAEPKLLFRDVLLCCLLLAAVNIFGSEAHKTACNQGNDTLCLVGELKVDRYEGLQSRLRNNGSYWFGEDYHNKLCVSPEDKMTDACRNPAPHFLTIIERMRMSNNSETGSVEQVLRVHYSKPAGSYMGCNGKVDVPAINKTLDAVHSIHEDSWALFDRPQVTWQTTANTLYTLVFWDAGQFELQGLWINAASGSLDSSEEVIPYTGPKSPYLRRNAYVFALYNQNATLDAGTALSIVWDLRKKDGNVALHKVVQHLNLTGPIGICPVVTQADYHTAQVARNMMIVNSCPDVQTYEIGRDRQRRFTWFNKTDIKLTMSVDVSYNSPGFTEESCCTRQNIPRKVVRVSATMRNVVEPVATKMAPHVRLIPTNFTNDPYFYLRSSLFTLLFVDVTEGKDYADPTNANLHWQVINIPKLNVQSGETVVSWLGAVVAPYNATMQERMYAFMLFKQNRSLTAAEVRSHQSRTGCLTGLETRCNFNLATFRSGLGLTLVGLSGHKSSPDAWSRYERYTSLGVNKNTACLGVAGFQNPCPTTPKCTGGVASLTSHGMAVLALAVTLCLVFQYKFWL